MGGPEPKTRPDLRVLLGRLPDQLHSHRSSCADCGRPVYLGAHQQALEARQEADVVVRCQACDDDLGDLRVLR